MNKKQTITSILKAKGNKPLVMITAYDALFAKLFDPYVDLILVGDSLNMSFAGHGDTLSTTLEQMIYHTNAVCNGAPSSFVICDMPFGTYNNHTEALDNAMKVFKQTKADAVKIEGGSSKASTVKYLVDSGIAVCGHIGLLPQSVRSEGGYKIKGKSEDDALSLIDDAIDIEKAGAFAIVIEGVKADVATRVAQAVSVPVIGIGAGNGVDGQVLVFSDMLGLFEEFTPKFVKKYLGGAELVKDSIQSYVEEVQNRTFPDEIHTY
jgi:3-methyl-2-oxobutanoate hydroxymethyltransferase